MSDVDPLVAFVKARLDEREAKALSVSVGPRQPEEWIAKRSQFGKSPRDWVVDCPFGSVVVDGAYEGCAEHIADNDPKFVLADVAAKRRIIDAYERSAQYWASDPEAADRDYRMMNAEMDGCLLTLRLLALPHAEHPDYRQVEWKP